MATEKQITYGIKEKKGMPIVKLRPLLDKWQKKLDMVDWKLSLEIVDFHRSDGFRQSGDFVADPKSKTATLLMTWDPWRGDEEYVLVHELLHILVYDYDIFCENAILKHCKEDSPEHDAYMDKLEKLVHQLTRILVGRSDR